MTNWSAIDPNSVGGRLLRLPVRMLPKSAVMTIRRGPAKGMKWIVGAATHGCWLGTYELDKQKSIQKFVRPGMIAYDVGAQAGFYTLILSRLVGDQGRVFAFEPNARELTYLIRHVSLNRLRNVEIVQAAVGEKTGTVPFTIDRGVTQNAIAEHRTGVTVAALALDSMSPPPRTSSRWISKAVSRPPFEEPADSCNALTQSFSSPCTDRRIASSARNSSVPWVTVSMT